MTGPSDHLGAVAVVGMAGRFPGAANLDEFWRHLSLGIESISHFSEQELEAAGIDRATLSHPNYVRARGVLEGAELFDAAFFGFNPREAEITDPQHRLFLECAWEALERAGCDPDRYDGRIGVFAGASINTYLLSNLYRNPEAVRAVGIYQALLGNDKDFVPTRVSYKLNLKGPSVAVQTACSTSLVAVHLACQSLLNGECDMALAGGVSVTVPQKSGYFYTEGGIASPDGHCRPFDAAARGTVGGDGVAEVVLKRLADAIADGDHIHAVIKGSAVNNDGSSKVGYTAPSAEGQAQVIAEALAIAGVEPEQVGYVEAHGTGTPLGDPIEVTALTRVFRTRTDEKGFCALGAVKSNVGHLDAAAGVTGLIKAILALENQAIPPSLHFEEPNPRLELESSPFRVNTALTEWKANGAPRRAGVSSFGIGGTNAHVVLEQAPAREPSGASRPWQLLVLSAKTAAALERAAQNLAEHLEQHPSLDVADVAHTLQLGRRRFPKRRVAVCRDRADALAVLGGKEPGRLLEGEGDSGNRPVVFMFSGQGAQYPNMARELYETEPVFREHVDHCARRCEAELGVDLREVLYPPAGTDEAAASRLEGTALAQPALFVIESGLARLWMEWGVRPDAMIGHSIGEYVAAWLSGVFSLEDGLALVCARGRLMQGLPGGAMLSVFQAEEKIAPLLGDGLSLAAVNGPELCVVSGTPGAVAALETRLEDDGVPTRRLHTSHAFHSEMMQSIVEPFAALMGRVELHPPQIPFLSNVTGTWIGLEDATDPAYWGRHLREPVRFGQGLAELLEDPDRILLEVGPGRTLATLARSAVAGEPLRIVASTRHPHEQQSDVATLLGALGRLWLAGGEIDWKGFAGAERRRRVPLPTYPFERQRYWVEPDAAAQALPPGALPGATAEQRRELADWFYLPAWKRAPSPAPRRAAARQDETWLVLGHDCGRTHRLLQELESTQRSVTLAVPGDDFARRADGVYVLRPAGREDYEALLGELDAGDGLPERILHMWTLDAPGASSSRELLELGFRSLFHLAQALGERAPAEPTRLDVVTDEMQDVFGDERIRPEKATLLGACRVLPQEYPLLRCRSIDLGAGDGAESERARTLSLLLDELAAPSSEAEVAFRRGRRWVRDFQAVKLEASDGRAERLREGGTYLITGGLGGIGLTLAEDLARSFRAKLALLGRSTFPARGEWDSWIRDHAENDTVSATIRKLRALEQAGAEVLVLRADVAREDQMRRAVEEIRGRFGAIHGVIHAAGLPGSGIAQLKTPEAADEVLAPKVQGTLVLDRLLADDELDFFVLCSSTTSILGGIGQLDYAAANAFLDAWASWKSARGSTFAVSIDWDMWREVGMAQRALTALGEADANRDGAAPQHPLLGRRILATPEHDVFETQLSMAQHWILDEHRLMGQGLVPGTAYLEMVRAAFEQRQGVADLELYDVFFPSPLVVAEGERRRVRTVLKKEGDHFAFRIITRAEAEDVDDPPWQEHAVGKVRRTAAEARPKRDLQQVLAECRVQETIEGDQIAARFEALVGEGVERIPFSFGPRWSQSPRHISIGENGILTLLELPEEFASDLETYKLHPALMDLAGGAARLQTGEDHYFPLWYKSLRVRGPLPQRLQCWIRHIDRDGSSRETGTLDIEIIDDQGNVLVEIDEFTVKRVNDAPALPELREPQASTGPGLLSGETGSTGRPHVAAGAGTPPPLPPGALDGILPAEGADAFRRILSSDESPRWVVSTKDLLASIRRMQQTTLREVVEGMEGAPSRRRHPRPELAVPYEAPRDELERKIAEIWQEVLGLEEVGIHDGFFDLGGHSLLAIQITSRMRDQLQVQLPLRKFFDEPSVAHLALEVGRCETLGEADAIRPVSQSRSQELLDRLDDLSEQEVDALLAGAGEA